MGVRGHTRWPKGQPYLKELTGEPRKLTAEHIVDLKEHTVGFCEQTVGLREHHASTEI